MATVEKIIKYFQENEESFNRAIEQLDAYNGWLNDDLFYRMEELDELYEKPLDAMMRAYYGHDAEVYSTDKDGTKHYGEFCPNRKYFYYNGNGNLVSCDYKDYSDYLTEETIREMAEHRRDVWEIDNDYDLSVLFDELEEETEEETEE